MPFVHVNPEPRADSLWRSALSCYCFEVDSYGNLNPTLLEIAKYGYYIESQILGIPDRWCLFNTGNPRLQVKQAAGLAVLVACVALFTSMQIPFMVYFYFHLPLLNFLGISAMMSSLQLGFIALVWLLLVHSKWRMKDHVWADWKARKE